jgi:hypothetical protein
MCRDLAAHNALKVSGVLLWLIWGGVVWGQTLTVEPLADRLVTPGEFVTLVYRITTSVQQTVTAQLTVSTGWLPLRPPAELALEPGRTNFLSVTLPVPPSAEAGSVATVTLDLMSETERQSLSHQLTVREQLAVGLMAPAEVVLGREAVTVTVTNAGNSKVALRLTLERGVAVLAETTLQLAPQTSQTHTFTADDEGLYSVAAYLAGEEVARRALRVMRFGVPPPEPLQLRGTLRAELGTAGYSVSLRGAGQLSDFVSAEGQLTLPNWSESFVALSAQTYQLRLGRVRGRSLGLSVPGYFGVAYQTDIAPYRLLIGGGWVRAQQFSVLVGGALLQDGLEAALIIGIASGQVFGGGRVQLAGDGTRVEAQAEYVGRAFSVRLRADTLLASAPLEVRAALEGLGSPGAQLRAASHWRSERWTLGGDITLPLAGERALDATLEARSRLKVALPGELAFGVRWGVRRSDAQLSYVTRISEALQLAQRLTLGRDAGDGYLRADTQLALTGASFIALDGALSYYPGLGAVDGALGVRGRLEHQRFTVSGEARWAFPVHQLAVGFSGAYSVDPLTIEMSAGLQYAAEPGASASFRVAGQYAWALPTPDGVVSALGGRNIGVLQGQVRAAELGIEGVLVQVGRYQLLTDALGRFEAQLPPGSYTVRLVEGSLPSVYQLSSAAEVSVVVGRGEVTTVAYLLLERAVIRGQITLEGAAPIGIRARLGVRTADGLLRLVMTEDDGSFTLRGLPPGPAEVTLLNLPAEYRVVGDARIVTELRSGAVSEVTVAIERIQIDARQFAAQQLRIRQATSEVERVPPGAAPLITVTLSAEAERVSLRTPEGVVPLALADDQVWQGRLPLPPAAMGIYPFTVVAEAAAETVERSAQLIVDAAAPAYSVTLSSPVRPGGVLTLSVQSYMALREIYAEVFGALFELTGDNDTGSWRLSISVPSDAEDAVYPLLLTGVRADGASFTERLAFRVLRP